MGDRVALMRRGVLQQVDSPMRLYHAPANLFVASLHRQPGDEPLRGAARPPQRPSRGADRRPVPPARARGAGRARASSSATSAAPLALGVRPEHIEDAALASPTCRRAAGCARIVRDGRGARLRADRPPRAVGQAGHDRGGQGGGRRHRTPASSGSWRPSPRTPRCPMVARFDELSRARPGQTIEVVVDTARIHFFDLDSGAAIGGHPAGLPPRTRRRRGPDMAVRQPGGHLRHHRARRGPAQHGAALRHAPGHARGAAVPVAGAPRLHRLLRLSVDPRPLPLASPTSTCCATTATGSGCRTTSRCSRTPCSGTRCG